MDLPDAAAARVAALALSQHAVLNILNLIDARQCTIFRISRPSLDISLVLPCAFALEPHDATMVVVFPVLELYSLFYQAAAWHLITRCAAVLPFGPRALPLLVRSQICGTALVASLASYT